MGAFQRDIEAALRNFVAYDNNERYRESLNNVTPADVNCGRLYEVLAERVREDQAIDDEQKEKTVLGRQVA